MIKIECLLLILLLSFFAYGQKDIKGSGYVITQQRDLSGYTQLLANRNVHIYVVQGEPQPVIIEADNNLFPYIKTVVHHHLLKAYIPDTVNIIKYADMNVLLSMPSLTALYASTGALIDASPQPWTIDSIRIYAASDSHIKLHLSARKIHIIAKTGAYIELRGHVSYLEANIKTAARLNAKELTTENARIQMATGAKAEIKVNDSVAYDLVGNSRLFLRGNPKVIHSALSSGSKVIHQK